MTGRLRALALGCTFVIAGGLLLPVSRAGSTTLRLNPVSLAFPTHRVGYALSLYDCTNLTCAALEQTRDVGVSWHGVPMPAAVSRALARDPWGTYGNEYATLHVYFANARNGWLYGSVPSATSTSTNPSTVSVLWSTHDAGATWTSISLASLGVGDGVVQMATHRSRTYLFGQSFTSGHAQILVTPSGSDAWVNAARVPLAVPAGGTPLQGSFAFSGRHGWFASGNDRGYLSFARLGSGGQWVAWPHGLNDIAGAAYAPLVESGGELFVVGTSAQVLYPPDNSVPAGWNAGSTWLFTSRDEGRTFHATRELAPSYPTQFPGVTGLPAVPRRGTILLERVNATTNHAVLMRSLDGGRSWRTVLRRRVDKVDMLSQGVGFAVEEPRSNSLVTSLLRTSDWGAHWRRVTL